MDVKVIAAEVPKEENGVISSLWRYFSEKPADEKGLEERWRKGFNDVVTYVTESVSHFLYRR